MILYAVTISGYKYYFTGDISESSIKMIDKFCDSLNDREIMTNSKCTFAYLYNYIRNDLGCKIEPISIEHVFRINL